MWHQNRVRVVLSAFHIYCIFVQTCRRCSINCVTKFRCNCRLLTNCNFFAIFSLIAYSHFKFHTFSNDCFWSSAWYGVARRRAFRKFTVLLINIQFSLYVKLNWFLDFIVYGIIIAHVVIDIVWLECTLTDLRSERDEMEQNCNTKFRLSKNLAT